jgi:hypothetical protein
MGVTYYYRVAAQNRFGTGEQSPGASALIPSSSAPSAPSKLSVKAIGCGAQLTWTAADGKGFPIVTYNIYRGTAFGQESIIGTVSSGLTYNDSNPGEFLRYYYRVSAVNTFGEGGLSKTVSVNAGMRQSYVTHNAEDLLLNGHQSPIAIITDTTSPQAQTEVQVPVIAGTGAVCAIAAITVVFSFTRSGFTRRKGIADKHPDAGEDLQTEKMITPMEQSIIETKELEVVEIPNANPESAPVQQQRDPIDVEFENALDELASMAVRY